MSEAIRYVFQMFRSVYADTKGYTDDAEIELQELERLADIGRATEKAFENGGWIQMMHIKDIDTTDDLLEWAKGGK